MNYPIELLPQSNNKIIDTDSLNESNALLRKSLKDKEKTKDSLGDVRIDAICEKEKDIFGLSSNLFGIYNCIHLSFIVKKIRVSFLLET